MFQTGSPTHPTLWQVVEIYKDAGISGAKDRDQRPGLDAWLKDASRRSFDVVMAWAIDRLGCSLIDLFGAPSALHTTRVFQWPAQGLIRANFKSPIPQTGMFALSHPADIDSADHLRLLAREQRLAVPADVRSPQELRAAIVAAAERRIANRMAAAS